MSGNPDEMDQGFIPSTTQNNTTNKREVSPFEILYGRTCVVNSTGKDSQMHSNGEQILKEYFISLGNFIKVHPD